jgi:mono/diheme cytochrome c family protein
MIDSLYQLIARTGFTDPLHAPVTHIPIGLVIGAFLFFLVAVIFGRKNLITTARHVSILAFLFVFPTILFGVFDWLHYYHGALIQPIKMKMILASVVLVVLAIGIIIGSEIKIHAGPMIGLYGLAFLAVIGLGWYGARLVPGVYAMAAGGAAPVEQPASQTAAKAATAVPPGQRIFNDNCASCHPNGGNVIEAKLTIRASKKLQTQDTFTAFIRAPKMPDGKEGQMPPFPADQITDKQAGDLYTYISSMLAVWK